MPNRQGKNGIGYIYCTWNPVRGKCLFDCEYCYMKQLFHRFKWDETLRINKNEMQWTPKKPCRIGVCFNLDLFHSEVPDYWVREVINVAWDNPKSTYLFLTKFPEGYAGFDFPENAWLGTTWDGLKLTENNAEILNQIQTYAGFKFISFEPLLRKPDFRLASLEDIGWIIIGADSRRGVQKIPQDLLNLWADGLISEARDLRIAVWIKKNLGYPEEIQEIPFILTDEDVGILHYIDKE